MNIRKRELSALAIGMALGFIICLIVVAVSEGPKEQRAKQEAKE